MLTLITYMIHSTPLLLKSLRLHWILGVHYNVLTYRVESLSRIPIINDAIGFFYIIHVMRLFIGVIAL